MTDSPFNPTTLYALGTDGKNYPVKMDPSTGKLLVDAVIDVGDIEIGAIEIKNGTDDTRAAVGPGLAANGLRTVLATDDPAVTALASILAALQAQRAETLWTDDTLAYFVRVDANGTISWKDISGATSVAPGTGARPVSGPSAVIDKSSYQATSAATGYSIGDLLDHVIITDPASGVVIGHFWINTTTELKLASSPSSANITPLSPLPTGAATQATLAALLAIFSGSALIGNVGISQAAPGTSDHVTGSGFFILASGTLALRANATVYTLGKIIAQSATAGSCSGVALAVGRIVNGTGMLRKLRLKINSATWLNAIVRVHLFKDTPTFTNADGGTFAAGLSESAYLGYVDVTLDQSFSDPFVKGTGVPAVGGEFNFDCSSGTQNIFFALEARSAVTADAGSKTFTLTAETLPN